MASMHSPFLDNFTSDSFVLSYSHFIKFMEGGKGTRVNVPREMDDQNAPRAEHSNQCNKRSVSKFVIFSCKIVTTEKQLLTPRLRLNNHYATTSGSTFSPRVCDFQPLYRSHARISLKETTWIVPLGVLSLALSSSHS